MISGLETKLSFNNDFFFKVWCYTDPVISFLRKLQISIFLWVRSFGGGGIWERWNCLSEGEVMELTIYKVLSNTQSNLLIFFCYGLHSWTKHLITCFEPMLIQQSTYPHAYANLSICLSALTQWGQRRFRPWDEPFSETSHFSLRWLTIYSFSP